MWFSLAECNANPVNDAPSQLIAYVRLFPLVISHLSYAIIPQFPTHLKPLIRDRFIQPPYRFSLPRTTSKNDTQAQSFIHSYPNWQPINSGSE